MNMVEFLKGLEDFKKYFTPEMLEFYDSLVENNKPGNGITENGLKILNSMADNEQKYLNVFTSKQLGELLFMPPRSVSGSMRKLVTEGYTEKKGSNPISYGLTDAGRALVKELNIDKQ